MTTDTPITAAAYADLVRAELADLGPDDLASMVEGLDAHLAEIAADGQADLAAALGSPAAYATELRSAAGLAAKAPVATGGAPQLQPSDRPRLPARVAAARAVVALALAFAVYAVIAADPTIITIPRTMAVAAGVGVVWWVFHVLVAHCALPPQWLGRGRAVVAVAALAAAAILGAELHATHNDGAGGDGAYVLTMTTVLPIDGADFTSTQVQVANCSAQNGVAGMMTSLLGDAGFTMAEPTFCPPDQRLTTSRVIFNEGTAGAVDVAVTLATILGLNAAPAGLPIKVESGAWAEGSGVVLLLGNDLAGKTLDQIHGTTPGTPTASTFDAMGTTTTVVFPTAPPQTAPGTLRFTSTMANEGGTAEVRDVDGQVCVFIRLDGFEPFNCYKPDAIDAGQAWSVVQAEHGFTLLYGLTPITSGFRLLLDGITIYPDFNGFWYAFAEEEVAEFTMVTDDGTSTVTIADWVTSSTTTTVVYNP